MASLGYERLGSVEPYDISTCSGEREKLRVDSYSKGYAYPDRNHLPPTHLVQYIGEHALNKREQTYASLSLAADHQFFGHLHL